MPKKCQSSYNDYTNLPIFINPSLHKTYLEIVKDPLRTDQVA